jgi:hypothetical protein
MALAYRSGSFVSAGGASGGDLTLTKPTGTVDGDIVVICVYFEPDTTTITVSDGPWESVEIANTGAFKLGIYLKEASSEPANYTISNSDVGDQWRAACGVAYSGGTGSGTRIDVSGSSQADGQLITNQTAPSVDTNEDDDMVAFGYGNYSGTNPDSTTGHATNFRGAISSTTIADAILATAGSTGTSRPANGPGTEDYAASHTAIISDIAATGRVPMDAFRIDHNELERTRRGVA